MSTIIAFTYRGFMNKFDYLFLTIFACRDSPKARQRSRRCLCIHNIIFSVEYDDDEVLDAILRTTNRSEGNDSEYEDDSESNEGNE